MPTSSIHFTPSRTKKNGISSMKTTSDICPSVCVAAMLLTPAAPRKICVKL
jgi:hypothetical protein